LETRVTYRLSGYSIAECSRCGFEYHDGFGGGGGEGETFSAEYYTSVQQKAFEHQFGDYLLDPSVPVYNRWLDRIVARGGSGRVLDVGSALGTFLKVAANRGFKSEGVEISAFAADFARTRHGLTIFTGDLERYPGASGSLDVVTFWDSIEHVTHPRENLMTAARLLRPGGLVLLATDNFDCLIADVARLMYRASFGRARYAMQRVFIAPNRSYFTEATLYAMLAACGFRVLESEKMEYPLDKIRTNAAERLVLEAFYATARVLRRQAQITVLAQKT